MKKGTKIALWASIPLVLLIWFAGPRLGFWGDRDLKVKGDAAAAPAQGQGAQQGQRPGGQQGGQQGGQLPVTATIAQPSYLTNGIRSAGTLLANEEVDIVSKVPGKVTGVYFREGSVVKKGDLLVKINSDEIQAQLLKLESQVKLAEEKERRRRLLFDKQNISPEDYEIALNELNSIKAEAKYYQARLEKTDIRAPFAGRIGLRYVSEGSYVSSTTRIASLQNLEQVKVDFAVPERYAQTVRVGQSIRFTRAGSEEVYAGKIFAIEPKIDPDTRTLQVRAISRNVGGRLLPGGFAEVVLELERFEAALMVPSQAIVPELGGQKVFIQRGGVAVGVHSRVTMPCSPISLRSCSYRLVSQDTTSENRCSSFMKSAAKSFTGFSVMVQALSRG